jgi:hypothetical protein
MNHFETNWKIVADEKPGSLTRLILVEDEKGYS